VKRAVAVGIALGLSVAFAAEHARAAEPEDALTRAEEHLRADRAPEAIAELEALADMGHLDAAISFDRGLAYAMRVKKGPPTDGDLGRAVLGFEEAKGLTSRDDVRAACDAAITALRSESAKRRSRGGEPPDVEEGMSLGRSVVHLLPESAWLVVALVASIAFSVGLVTGRRAKLRGESSQLSIALGFASLPLCLTATTLGLAARAERRELREGIVIRAGVRPFDESHIVRTGAETLPEGAKLRIVGEDAGFVVFRRGAATGTLPKDAVAEIVKRR
jgi:hypothetical protein